MRRMGQPKNYYYIIFDDKVSKVIDITTSGPYGGNKVPPLLCIEESAFRQYQLGEKEAYVIINDYVPTLTLSKPITGFYTDIKILIAEYLIQK